MSLARRQSRGAAVLIFLTIVILALTTLLVATLSPNAIRTARTLDNTELLGEASLALAGFALRQQPVGVLPCPDADGDGLADSLGIACASQLGLIPFRTLNVPRLNDAAGATLWYSVEPGYVGAAPAPKNGSAATTVTLDGAAQAAVVLAPGGPVAGQARVALSATDFLEGVNAALPLNVFASVFDEDHNDQVSGLDIGVFWSAAEGVVLAATADLLNQYRASCGEFPWAGTFGGPFVSGVGARLGSVPFDGALPFNWGAACPFGAAPVPPAWLANNWRNQIYYRMCLVVEGQCVSVSGLPAAGVLIAPGIALGGQTRNTANPADYFEGNNATLPDTVFTSVPPSQHTATYNDVTRSL